MEQMSLDAGRVDLAVQALKARSRDARPLVMRWAVATVALSDIIRAEREAAVSWAEMGAVVAGWLEEFGRSTGQWKTHTEAALRMSKMGSEAPPSLDSQPPAGLDGVDRRIALLVQRHGALVLRVSLAIVFVWFGVSSTFASSPVHDITTKALPFIPPRLSAFLLGLWDSAIGVGLLYAPLRRVAPLLSLLRLPVAALPLIALRDICFTHFPYAPALEGQCILEHLALLGAAVVVAGTVPRGP